MTMLVTLEQAKAHLRVTHAYDDADIELKIHAASAAIIEYLKEEGADPFLDSSGEVLMTGDSPPEPDVPRNVQQATLLLVGDFFKNREPTPDDVVPAQYGYGYLPRAVVALLYMRRDPTLK
jgi:hypothetical protein